MIMIDSVAEHVARKLSWDIEPTSRLFVVLGDGTHIHARGVCKNIPLVLSSELFQISCYVFPLSSIDFILGVSWLATVGDVKANWGTLTMKFSVEGKENCLYGDTTLTRKACTFHGFQSLDGEDECWLLRAMYGDDQNKQVSTRKELSVTAQDEMAAVFVVFPSASAPSAGLPPVCTSDHRTVFQPRARPVPVGPYRYNN